ncbi:hypothetical protein CRG98_012103 [Punica granatum]|uniref:Uncharacterized protein n=1 Tax=Punica granatum TaxID=22663 RepID=A0A2I0KG94_PUNGR|nr:hypothetical protein CRG98_012103 [Punica granatum]
MTRLSTPMRSPIGSPTKLNRPKRALPQAQWAIERAIRTVRDNLHDRTEEKRGYCKQQELLRALIPDPSGYVGVPPQSSSPSSHDRGILSEAAAPMTRLVPDKSRPSGLHVTQSSSKCLGHTTIRKL